MRKKVKPPSDPLKIYIQAERFRFADATLRRDPRAETAPQYMAYIGLPSIILSAFASELYLKCLLALEGKPIPVTHNLKSIYKRLQGKTQNRITERWASIVQLEPNRITFIQSEFNYDITDLKAVLADGSTAFEELRYAYEGQPKTKFAISNLPWALRDEVWEQKPEFKNMGPNFGEISTSHSR